MRKIELSTVTSTKPVVTEFKCDLCGVVTVKEDSVEHVGDWSNTDWPDRALTEVKLTVGQYTGASYETTSKFFDICCDCFNNVLVPFLESKGANLQTEDNTLNNRCS